MSFYKRYSGFGALTPSGLVPRMPVAPTVPPPAPFTPRLLSTPILTLATPPPPPPVVGLPPWFPSAQNTQAAAAKAALDAQMAALQQAKDAAAARIRQAVSAANAKAAADAAAAKAAADAERAASEADAWAQGLQDLSDAAGRPTTQALPSGTVQNLNDLAQAQAMAAAVAQAKADQKAADAAEAQAKADAQTAAAQQAAASAQHASDNYHALAATLPPLPPRVPTWAYVVIPAVLAGVGFLLLRRRSAPKMSGLRRRRKGR